MADKKAAGKDRPARVASRSLTVSERVQLVRDAVAEASTGIEGEEYREIFETLISDADGWRMELEEM